MQRNDNKYVNRSKSLSLKLTPDIVMTLKKLYNHHHKTSSFLQFVAPKNISKMLSFIETLLDGCGQVGQGYQ